MRKLITDNLEKTTASVKSVYGGGQVIVEYDLKTYYKDQDGLVNIYHLVAEVRGLDNGEPFMSLLECTPLTNNEDTLVMDVIRDHLDW